MNRNQWLLRSLAIAALSLGSLGLAACSRPTPAGGGDAGRSESIPPGPYYEDDGSSAPGDESYPPPPTAVEDLDDAYPAPTEEDAATDDAASTDEAAGDEGDAAGDDSSDDSAGEDSSDEG